MLKRIIKQIKAKSIDAIPVVVFLIILISALNIYVTKNDTMELQEYNEKTNVMTKQEQWSVIEMAIRTTDETAKENTRYLSSEIESDVRKKYKDMSVLEKQFEKNIFKKDFYNLLGETLSFSEVNHQMYPEPYRTSVATKDGLIAVFSNVQNGSSKSSEELLKWNEYYNLSPNPAIAEYAIGQIMEQGDGIIFTVNKKDPRYKDATYIDLDTLKSEYLKDGEKALESVSILAPGYVKNKSDLFGTTDVSFMKRNDTHKLFIIQTIKLSQILDRHEETIRLFEQKQLVTTNTIDSYITHKFGIALIWSFALFAMALILISIYNYDRDRCSRCTRGGSKLFLGGDETKK